MDFMTIYYIYDLVYSIKAVLWFALIFIIIGIVLHGYLIYAITEEVDGTEAASEVSYKTIHKTIVVLVVGMIFNIFLVNIMPSQKYLAYMLVKSSEDELKSDISQERRLLIKKIVKKIVEHNFVDDKSSEEK